MQVALKWLPYASSTKMAASVQRNILVLASKMKVCRLNFGTETNIHLNIVWNYVFETKKVSNPLYCVPNNFIMWKFQPNKARSR